MTPVSNEVLGEKLDHVVSRVDDIHLSVFGNATPEHGLAFRVANNERFINAQKKILWIIATASIGSLIAALFTIREIIIHAASVVP